MTERPQYLNSLNACFDAETVNIRAFRNFPIVIDRLKQIDAAYRAAPAEGYSLEFGVFTGGSIRALALRAPKDVFHGFDSFEGLPEAWSLSPQQTHEKGHFKLSELPPVPANVQLAPGFFDATLDPWLKANPGPVKFVHIDSDLYSSAKFVLDRLSDRFVDGAVIVFDELCDWEESGVYSRWLEGEWKALLEWLARGFHFRILSRSQRFQAAIQVFRTPPKPRVAKEVLELATCFWDAGCGDIAIGVLDELARAKPGWLGGNHRLATWKSKARDPQGVLEILDRLKPAFEAQPAHAYATDAIRLRADSHLRLGDAERAYREASSFVDARPDHAGGVALAARAATNLANYEEARRLWLRAFCLTGDRRHNFEARMAAQLCKVRPELRSMKFSSLAIEHLLAEREFRTALDIGSGAGEQAEALRRNGKIVTELDYGKSKYFVMNPDEGGAIIGDFMKVEIEQQFDCVLASHVLEHQLNVGDFLRKLHGAVKEGGVVAISVPPAKPNIVGGHLTLWNAGLLLYNLVLAGFDCSKPWVRRYGYNISVVLEKRTISPAGLQYDSGDIDRIREFLPEGFGEGFDGDIFELG